LSRSLFHSAAGAAFHIVMQNLQITVADIGE
jgi:hypothetical protein